MLAPQWECEQLALALLKYEWTPTGSTSLAIGQPEVKLEGIYAGRTGEIRADYPRAE